jgi:hypothetical protein
MGFIFHLVIVAAILHVSFGIFDPDSASTFANKVLGILDPVDNTIKLLVSVHILLAEQKLATSSTGELGLLLFGIELLRSHSILRKLTVEHLMRPQTGSVSKYLSTPARVFRWVRFSVGIEWTVMSPVSFHLREDKFSTLAPLSFVIWI